MPVEKPGQTPQEEPEGAEGFAAPPSMEAAAEDETPDEDGEGEPEALPPEVDGGLTAEAQLKAQIEEQLQASTQHAEAVGAFEGAANVVAVGLGVALDGTSGLIPGSPVLNVYVVESASEEEVRSVIVQSLGVQAASSEDAQINVIVSGVIDAEPHRGKYRPAPGGVSVGHYKITAGTLGCLARARNKLGGCDKGKHGDRRGRILILSNNHVLANSNDAKCLDPILQPGPYDGGKNPADKIALLEQWIPLQYGAGKVNYVDAAVGWAWPNLVRRQLICGTQHFSVSNSILGVQNGMAVGKSGRTTQCTAGQIIDVSWSGWVNYGGGRRAFFRDQFVVRSTGSKPFSAGGDSGSLIWTANSRRNPVGLLFAGGGGLTIANKIGRVLNALDIYLYT